MLQNSATGFLRVLSGKEGCARGVLKNFANTLTRLGRAFKIMLRTDLLRDCHTLHAFDKSIRDPQ
jgi:hypothetical protein